MSNLRLIIPFLIILLSPLTIARKSQNLGLHRRSRTQAYIEVSCRYTRFPNLCVRSLTSYAKAANVTILNSRDLAQYALSFSLYRAQSTRTLLLRTAKELKAKRAKEFSAAVKDCLAQLDLSVEELYMSVKELHEFARKTPRHGYDRYMVSWHISNIEMWIGSALTGATSCVDEFQGRKMSKVKATITAKVLNVAEVTSIALALFHRFASRYHKP